MDTLHNKFKITQIVFKRVFSKGYYLTLTLGVFSVGASLVLILPNITALRQVLTSETLGLSAKLIFWLSLYGSLATNHSLPSAISTILFLLLLAIDSALLVFYLRRAKKATRGLKRSQIKSLVGAISGVLGIGCAACGSVILTGLAASLGATGILLALPLHGGEFVYVGIVLLSWSIAYLVKKINDPLICTSKN